MLNPDFRDILSAFCAEQVEFMVVGGYAMAFHGYVRATGDIDLWVRCSEENAVRIWRALQKFGAPLFDLTLEDLKTPGIVFQIGIVPSRIDVLTQITAVEFEEARQTHQTVEIEGMMIPVIGKQELLLNKKSTDRSKGKADVLWLESE